VRIAILVSRVRVEEKMLLRAFRAAGADAEFLRITEVPFGLDEDNPLRGYEGILIRCIGHLQCLYTARIAESLGIKVVNPYRTIQVCGDKLLTTLALLEGGVPATAVAFSPGASLAAMEALGFPVVVKPLHGSWGRLLAKLNDPEAAEALLEHKKALGGYTHSVFYLQEYVSSIGSPGRPPGRWAVGSSPWTSWRPPPGSSSWAR